MILTSVDTFVSDNRHRSLLYICARSSVRERAHTQAQIACTYAGANKIMSCFLAPERKDRRERDYASSGTTLPSADRATPVERPSHSRQLLVPREWHALRIRIRIPYACTTIPLMDARRLPLWAYVHADAPRHPC